MAPKQKRLTEKLLQWIWENQLLTAHMRSESGEEIEVLSPGRLNLEDGPDFRHSAIKLSDELLEGDIEVHLLTSRWFAHRHQYDPKYDNVLLHVVWGHDSRNAVTQSNKLIPTLNISKYGVRPLSELSKEYKKAQRIKKRHRCTYAKKPGKVLSVLESEGLSRFDERKQRFADMATTSGLEQAAYFGVLESLGYVKNESPFGKLADLVPIEKVRFLISGKPKAQRVRILKSTLLGVADLPIQKYKAYWNKIKHQFDETMRFQDWQYFKVRPPAFPCNRIQGISYFLADTAEKGICAFFRNAFPDMKKIEDKLSQGSISKTCARTIILNVCLPLLAIYDHSLEQDVLRLYQNYKKLPKNSISKLMSKILLPKRNRNLSFEVYYQGMIRIFHHYCRDKQCDHCPVKQLTEGI